MESEVNPILVAAHELKAPLATLRQLAFAIDGVPTEDLSARHRFASQMIDVSDRALRQVTDLTKISRLEDGLFEMEPVSPRRVCDDVTRELRYLYRYNHRHLKIDYRNKSHLVSANRDLLYSVIYNFCLNAMHYSGPATTSTLTVKDHKDKVNISVRDFGPALPNNIYKELKKGWIENPTSIAMRPGSSGLGLYIASRFSRYMHAEVGAIRHRDGTSFFIELPISKQASLPL